MDVFGYIRFSYMGRSDVRLARQDYAGNEFFDTLFNPRRMDQRFYFFENICLPSIRAQTDQDFTIFILASRAMPQDYKTRLEALVAPVPQIRIVYEDAEDVVKALAPTIEAITAAQTGNSIHFRLDDDDAIGAGLVADLRRLGRHAEPGTILSLPKGFHLIKGDEGTFLLPKHRPFIAIGFAFVCGPERIRNPYASAHLKAHRKAPSIQDPRPFSYIHVTHAASDTYQAHQKRLSALLEEYPNRDRFRYKRKLRAYFESAFPGWSVESVLEILNAAPADG